MRFQITQQALWRARTAVTIVDGEDQNGDLMPAVFALAAQFLKARGATTRQMRALAEHDYEIVQPEAGFQVGRLFVSWQRVR